MAGEYTLLITDPDLVVVGDPIADWSSLDVTLRFNEPSSGLFTAPGYSPTRDQLLPGYRVVVIRDGAILMSGPIEKRTYERSDDGENAGDGVITVDFADDFARIAARQAYPNPALIPEDQTTDTWTFTGNAEVGMRQLVNDAAGPGALTARQVPSLVLGSLAGVGGSITAKAEIMEPIGDVLRRMAADGGGLGFRTRQVGSQILFEVFDPPDVSDTVRFGFRLGNMQYLSYEVTAPKATTVIVGGQGEGADRFVLERTDAAAEAAWGRYEMHVARPGSDPVADLQDDGDQALRENAETARLSSNVVDTADQMFGVHYTLGSVVSLETAPGDEVTDVVQTVHLQAWPTAGERVSAIVASQEALSDPTWVRRLRDMDRRVGRLERTAASAA
jgi:hypothetical protein